MADKIRYFHDDQIHWRVHPDETVEHLLDGEWVESLATLQALILNADIVEDVQKVLDDEPDDQASVSPVTDDMVEAAASELLSDYASEYVADHLTWRDFEDQARRVLSAALAGCTVVALPEPDARTVRAFVEYWNVGETLPQEERFALQRLADIREARRLAVGSQEDTDD